MEIENKFFGSGGGVSVLSPIAPGLVREAMVRSWRLLDIGELVAIHDRSCVLALDGERSLQLPAERLSAAIRVNWTGPRLLDVAAAMEFAAAHGLFLRPIMPEAAGE